MSHNRVDIDKLVKEYQHKEELHERDRLAVRRLSIGRPFLSSVTGHWHATRPELVSAKERIGPKRCGCDQCFEKRLRAHVGCEDTEKSLADVILETSNNEE